MFTKHCMRVHLIQCIFPKKFECVVLEIKHNKSYFLREYSLKYTAGDRFYTLFNRINAAV